jgi:hypothetical protein
MFVRSLGNQIEAKRSPVTFNMKVSCILTSNSMRVFYHLHRALRPPAPSLDPCISVILLVLSLKFLCRLDKEYDRFLARQYRQHSAPQTHNLSASEEPLNGCIDAADPKHNQRDYTGIVTTSRAEYQPSSSRNGRYATFS